MTYFQVSDYKECKDRKGNVVRLEKGTLRFRVPPAK
jgi:hypothetical protein